MLAVLQDKPGDPHVLYLGQADTPTLGDNDVLIKADAVSVNRADTLQRRGLYPVPAGVSQVLGLECAGHVTEVGRLGPTCPGARLSWRCSLAEATLSTCLSTADT